MCRKRQGAGKGCTHSRSALDVGDIGAQRYSLLLLFEKSSDMLNTCFAEDVKGVGRLRKQAVIGMWPRTVIGL
jgi:hypothetical protein